MNLFLALVITAFIVCACGVKGPPLPPEAHPLAEPTPAPTATPDIQ